MTSSLGNSIAGDTGAVTDSVLPAQQQVVLLLVRFRPGATAWGLMQLMRAPFRRARDTGLVFQKVLGSGQNGGFGLRPGLNYQGLFSVFNSDNEAASYLQQSPQVAAYLDHAEAAFAAQLAPLSCRGAWSGFTFRPVPPRASTVPNEAAGAMPVASLTRASIRPLKAAAFWAQSPAAEHDLAEAPGCQLAVGLGEAPLLRQATFSLWKDQASMDGYARSGAHQRAIAAAYGQGFFSESMFLRFLPVALYGAWNGLTFSPFPASVRGSSL
ncbi:MAG: spheroidene monooxygenase [Burkholderiaceae bacterium]